MGITHIVMFRFKQGLPADTIKDACERLAALSDNCVQPSSQKPYIKSTIGGVDNSPEGIQGGITHAFVMEFENPKDRDYYVHQDPAHLAFVKSLDGLVEKVQAVDFTDGVF